MTSEKFLNIYRLMAEYNLEFNNEVISDNLKCVKCKSILKDACQLPCGCGICRICIDGMIDYGNEFCPGVFDECRESRLSHFLRDYRANLSISRLIVRCPQNGCSYECPLINIDEHLRVCPKKGIDCPFYELGCMQGKLTVEEMIVHLHQENGTHSEMLIGTIANMNNETEGYKRDICILKQSEENNKREIEMLKQIEEVNRNEIEMLKRNLLLKNGEIRMLLDENKSIKDENELIKAENQSNKNVIESIKEENKLIKEEIKSMKADLNLIQMIVGQVDARCELVVETDIKQTPWGWGAKMSNFFLGVLYPYKYRLASSNYGETGGGLLRIDLCIYPGPSDAQLRWPFQGTIAVTVSEKDKPEACRSISRHCQIEEPAEDYFSYTDPFVFPYDKLVEAGINLATGVRMSCQVVPMEDP